MFPKQISFKKGGYIAAAIALVLYPFAPWEGNAAHFVNAIGATMGPLLGIILVDYYLVAKGNINVAALYQEHGEYRYEGGWNVNALVSAAIGSVFSTFLPNFTNLLPVWWNTYGWFFGYGANPPHAAWPGGARIAVQFVLNYEEGAERSVLHGDPGSRILPLGDGRRRSRSTGMRHMSMESLYEYGSRAGFWRLRRLFDEFRACP